MSGFGDGDIVGQFDPRKSRMPVPVAGIFDEPHHCVPINVDWRGYLIGVIERLAWGDVWLGDDAAQYGAVQEIYKLVDLMALGVCEVPVIFRQSPTNDCVLQQSKDDGSTWSDAFDFSACIAKSSTIQITAELNIANEFNITSFATYAGDITNIYINWGYGDAQDVDRDTAMCYAIRRWVNWACATMIQLINDGNTSSDDAASFFQTVATTLGGTALGLSALAIYPVAALYGGLGLIAAGLLIEFIDLVDTTSTAPYEDESAKNEVVCLIYEHMVGVTPTYALWSGAATHPLSGNAEKIRAVAYGLMQDETGFVDFMGLMVDVIDAATEAKIENNCLGCVWEEVFDFTVDNGGWSIAPYGYSAAYIAATGWSTVDLLFDGNYYRAVSIGIAFDPSTVTWIEIEYNVVWGAFLFTNQFCIAGGVLPNGTTMVVNYVDRPLGANPKQISDDIDADDQTSAYITIRTSYQASAVYTGSCTITKVTLRGRGDNPFA